MRLFVALDLPTSVVAALRAVDLPRAHGIRPVRFDQMHITLHFIGAAEIDDVRGALETVSCKSCPVSIRGLGRFGISAGRSIIWAGVDTTEELLELHTECGQALAAAGVRIDRRRFVPHVTIARLKSPADKPAIDALLRAGRERNFGSFVARRFVLYDSVAVHGDARYERLAAYALT